MAEKKTKVQQAAAVLGHLGGLAAKKQKKGIFSPAYKKKAATKKKTTKVSRKKTAKRK